ncbi:hypothetical protein CR513_07633, partial [Mucuna pruriens]
MVYLGPLCLTRTPNWFPHIEYAYNHINNSATAHTSFKLVCGFNLTTLLDLLPLSSVSSMINCNGVTKAKFVKDLHAKVHLRKERFPCADEPSKIIKKINDNSYILEMPETSKEVIHLITLHSNLKENSFKEGEPNKDLGSLQEDTQEVPNLVHPSPLKQISNRPLKSKLRYKMGFEA